MSERMGPDVCFRRQAHSLLQCLCVRLQVKEKVCLSFPASHSLSSLSRHSRFHRSSDMSNFCTPTQVIALQRTGDKDRDGMAERERGDSRSRNK